MGRNKESYENTISIGLFIENYILPYLNTSLDAEKLSSINDNLSHLDLDELGLPGVKRIADKDKSKYRPGEIIAVKAKGYLHKGYEVHYYLRPFDLLTKNSGDYITSIRDNVLLFDKEDNETCEERIHGEEKYKQRKLNRNKKGLK
jgi:hypothetical protein